MVISKVLRINNKFNAIYGSFALAVLYGSFAFPRGLLGARPWELLGICTFVTSSPVSRLWMGGGGGGRGLQLVQNLQG